MAEAVVLSEGKLRGAQSGEPVSSSELSMIDDGWPTDREVTLPRYMATSGSLSCPSGTLRLSFFTAKSAIPRTQMVVNTAATAAGATPTLIRGGVYLENYDGSLTLQAAFANATGTLNTTYSNFTHNLTTPWQPIVGRRYASALLVVSAAATPLCVGFATYTPQAAPLAEPKLCGLFAGQTDLPASIAVGDIAASGVAFFHQFL